MPDIAVDLENLAMAIPALNTLTERFEAITSAYPGSCDLIFQAAEGSSERDALIALGKLVSLLEYNSRRSAANCPELAAEIAGIIERHAETDEEAEAILEEVAEY